MIIFSLIFISAFCAIQVKNQMTAVNNFNLYRARLSALVVKNNLERVLGDHDAAIAAEPVPAFAGALASLKKNAIIEEATIFTTKCEIVTSLETSGEDRKIKPADYRIIEEYASAPRNDSWFIPNIDQARGVIDLYIPLLKSAQALYIAKLSFSLGNIEGALKQVYI
ncbi:MAG: hypothetical protein WCG78_03865, partial [Candidatus Omnitrophota bacterium]